MDVLLNDTVSKEDLQKFEKIYEEQKLRQDVTPNAQFNYACCLVRSEYKTDTSRGILLLEDLCRWHESGRRDYLYYLAIGYLRTKEYSRALQVADDFLAIEPGNMQVAELRAHIKKELQTKGLKGMLITSSVMLGLGAVIAGAIQLARK